MKKYYLDTEMLGSEFKGSNDDLENFADILSAKLPAEWDVLVVFDSYNGAKNSVEMEDDDTVKNAFNNALDEHSNKYPLAWT
jgi:hypothetical protein